MGALRVCSMLCSRDSSGTVWFGVYSIYVVYWPLDRYEEGVGRGEGAFQAKAMSRGTSMPLIWLVRRPCESKLI